MRNDDLQLLRDFREEVPAPDEETRRRIYAYATREPETRLRTRWRLPAVAVAAAVAAATVAVLLVSPWSGSGGLVQRALAAVGSGPVLHVVTEQPEPLGWYQPVSLPSGKPIQVTQRQEIWFDQSRDLKKTITTLNGVVTDRLLETKQGGFTPTGPVYTCAWIAAHPVEATRARVSCNLNGENGTKPRKVPEQPPTLDLALAGFVDHYQSALASGQATKVGVGQVDGHPVIWLRINAQSKGGYPAEEVAVDASTYTPVLVHTTGPRPVQFKVTEIDTGAYDRSLFTRPAREYPPTSGSSEGTSQISVGQAPALLGGKALWLGQAWNGYQLVKVEQQELVTGYGPTSGKKATHSVGVVFTYAPPGGSAESADALQVKEASQCEMGWAMPCGAIRPTEGTLLLGLPFSSGITSRDGLYIAIGRFSGNPVAVANALRPLSKS